MVIKTIFDLSLEIEQDYSETQLKIYEKALQKKRVERQEIVNHMERTDEYLDYTRQLRKRVTQFLEMSLYNNYKQQHNQLSNLISSSKMEKYSFENFDDIRIELIKHIKNLQKLLEKYGEIKEAEELKTELKKLKDNTYQIAFIATTKAGKSTLINAMIGWELLPSLEKVCTGRLTYINHVEGETVAYINIKTPDKTLVISYSNPHNLEQYINKYLQTGQLKNVQIYSKQVLNLIYKVSPPVATPFIKPDNEQVFAHQAKLQLQNSYLQITNPEYQELGSFINNPDVTILGINTPIPYLKECIALDGIQFVDTPGPNSAAHAEHKPITYDFITKANAVIYMIDFTKFDTTDEEDLLKNIKAQRYEYDPNFSDKFFFVINKIDAHEAAKGDLETKLKHIRQRIQKEYGYNVPDSHFIAVGAKPGLLYRLDKKGLLHRDDPRKKDFNGYLGRFLNLDEPWNITPDEHQEAKQKVFQLSNIEGLEQTLVHYLKTNNATQQLILDAINKSQVFAHNVKREISNEIGMIQASLNRLEQLTIELDKWIMEAETTRKKNNALQASYLDELTNIIQVEYDTFKKNIHHVMTAVFEDNTSGALSNLTEAIGSSLVEALNAITIQGDSYSKNEIKTKIDVYNEKVSLAIENLHADLESKLKVRLDEERKKRHNKLHEKGNDLLHDLNKKVNEFLHIQIDSSFPVFPPFEFKPTVANMDEFYQSELESKNEALSIGGGSIMLLGGVILVGGILSPVVLVGGILSPVVAALTLNVIGGIMSVKGAESTRFTINKDKIIDEMKKALNELISERLSQLNQVVIDDMENIGKQINISIDTQIGKIKNRLHETLKKRKSAEFDSQKKLLTLEQKLDAVIDCINTFNFIAKHTHDLDSSKK